MWQSFLCYPLSFPVLHIYSSFSPTDTKLATCSEDGTVRTFDFIRCAEEFILRGVFGREVQPLQLGLPIIRQLSQYYHALPRVCRAWGRCDECGLAPEKEPLSLGKQGQPAAGEAMGSKGRPKCRYNVSLTLAIDVIFWLNNFYFYVG